MKVYWLTASRWDGSYLRFDPNELRLNQVIISPLGGNGYLLSQILDKGYGTEFALTWREDELIDITKWFLDTYEKDGRCIFDREHYKRMLGAEGRFTYINNTRRCNWCGQWQHKQIKKVQTIERVVNWI